MAKAAKKKYIKTDAKRIEVISFLIEKGHIKTWADIFEHIPRTVIALHLGINNTRMKELVADPSDLSLERLAAIASFLQLKFSVVSDFAYNAMPVEKRLKKKS